MPVDIQVSNAQLTLVRCLLCYFGTLLLVLWETSLVPSVCRPTIYVSRFTCHRVPSMKRLGVLQLPLDGMSVHHRIPGMKLLGVLQLPLDGMLVHHRVPSTKQLGVLLLPLGGMPVHPYKNEGTWSITPLPPQPPDGKLHNYNVLVLS